MLDRFIEKYLPFLYRFKTPNFLQIEVAECGSTCLGIILGYYKKFVSAEELRLRCGVSRNGSKAVNIIKAARYYGMAAQGAEVEDISQLKKEHFPLIAFWDFDHFVVVECVREKYIYINDPAQGPRALDYKTFNQSFTGIVILMNPGAEFIEDGADPHQLPSLRPIIKKYSAAFVFITIATLASLIPALIIPATAKIFVDYILTKNLDDWLRPLLITLAGISLLSVMIVWLQETFLLRANVRITAWFMTRFVWHILNLPLSFFASRHSGDVLLRVKSIHNLSQLISNGLSSALISSIVAIFYLIIMFFLSIKLTMIILLMTLMGLLITWFHKKYLLTYNQQALQSMNHLTGIEIGGLRSIETLKASGGENEFLNKRMSALAKVMKNRQKLFGFGMSLGSSTQIVSSVMAILLMTVASLMIMDGQLTLGTFVAFQVISGGFISPLLTLAGLTAKLQEAKTHLIRLKDALNHPIAAQTAIPIQDQPISLNGEINIQNVTFAYAPTESPVVANANLHIPAKTMCAMVGKSGSGKSTLALLLAGLYLPTEGKIFIDNISLEEMDQGLRKKAIAFIDADIGIFEGTLYDNLTLFQSSIPPETIAAALKDSCLDDVLESINGLQGLITENGGNLSGGQKQRIEIARALIQGAKILILDEAMSALDSLLEAKIYKNLKKIGCTLLIISHRLSSIIHCDKIIVMEAGHIVEQGTHRQLMRKSPLYKQLVSSE